MGMTNEAYREEFTPRRRVAAGRVADPDVTPLETLDEHRSSVERRTWERRFGAEWVEALDAVAREADERGIPIQAGSSEMLLSAVAQSWGWGAPPAALRASCAMTGELLRVPGAWVLRVPPGCAGLIRSALDGNPALAPNRGTPWIQVEESPLVYLPSEHWSSSRWPAPESWTRAARLLEPWAKPRREFVPADWLDLVGNLAKSLAPERVLLRAWDLWRAAVAAESDQGAYWLARQSAGFTDPESARRWQRQAWEWGIRVLEPCAERSGICARRERNFIRLGLEYPVQAAKRSLLANRHRHRRRTGFVARVSRRIESLRVTVTEFLEGISRLGSGGGISFPPHMRIAHTTRSAAPRPKSFVRFRRPLREVRLS